MTNLEKTLEQIKKATAAAGYAHHLCIAAFRTNKPHGALAAAYASRVSHAAKNLRIVGEQLELAVERERKAKSQTSD